MKKIKLSRRQKRRLKRILRNNMLRGSVFGALLMTIVPAQLLGGSKSAVIMCLLATIYITLFIGANYIIPHYDGHYYLWPVEPWEAPADRE